MKLNPKPTRQLPHRFDDRFHRLHFSDISGEHGVEHAGMGLGVRQPVEQLLRILGQVHQFGIWQFQCSAEVVLEALGRDGDGVRLAVDATGNVPENAVDEGAGADTARRQALRPEIQTVEHRFPSMALRPVQSPLRHHHRRELVHKHHIKVLLHLGKIPFRRKHKAVIVPEAVERPPLAGMDGTAVDRYAAQHLIPVGRALIAGVNFPFGIVGRPGDDSHDMPLSRHRFANIGNAERLRLIILTDN